MAKKKKKSEEAAEAAVADGGTPVISLRAYPAAMTSIRRVRARAALAAFALVLLLSLHSGVLLPEATARALAAGVAVHLAAWKLAVLAWRQIVLGQLRAIEDARRERARQRAEAQARAAEAIKAAQAA
jgi:hypothetical protein